MACMGNQGALAALFDHLPETTFFVKNADSVLLAGNQRFYERFGFADESQLIGKTDFDMFPSHMAEHFQTVDREVMNSKMPRLQIVELFFNRLGIPDWHVTNKFPITNHRGVVIGLMGTSRSYEGAKKTLRPYLLIDKAVDVIRNSFREKLSVAMLARVVGLSERQFLRRFGQAFGCSPQSFILKTRISAACTLLSQEEQNISIIAKDCGFADGSSFTQLFQREMGETPLIFRRKYRIAPASPFKGS